MLVFWSFPRSKEDSGCCVFNEEWNLRDGAEKHHTSEHQELEGSGLLADQEGWHAAHSDSYWVHISRYVFKSKRI